MTNNRMHPFINPGKTNKCHFNHVTIIPGICAFLMATTKGDAAAPISLRQRPTFDRCVLAFLTENTRSGESKGKIRPNRKTVRTENGISGTLSGIYTIKLPSQ